MYEWMHVDVTFRFWDVRFVMYCVSWSCFWTICFVFCVLFVICIFCSHNTLYTCLYYLLPTCCFCCMFRGFFPHPTPRNVIVPQPDRPPRRPTAFILVPPHVFVINWPHPWGRRPRGLNYKGKMHRKHIKKFNIHTQHLLLVTMAFCFIHRCSEHLQHHHKVYTGKLWAVKSLKRV